MLTKDKIKFFIPFSVLCSGFLINKLLASSAPSIEVQDDARVVKYFIEPVVRQSLPSVVKSFGQVNARAKINVVAQVSGEVVYIHPHLYEGSIVKANSKLIGIERSDYELAVVKAQYNLVDADIGVQQNVADAAVARKQLIGNEHSSLALKKPQVASARAKLAAARADLQLTEKNLLRTQVTLPFDGLVRVKHTDVGHYAIAGSVLAEVYNVESAEIRLPFSDTDLAKLGLHPNYQAPAEEAPIVGLSANLAGQEHHWQGRLVRIDAGIDPQTRTVYGYVRVLDPYGRGAAVNSDIPLAIGTYVEATLAGAKVEDVLTVPLKAIRGGNKVYVIEEGVLHIRTVDVIHEENDRAAISGDIEEGEMIVTSPVRAARDGMEAVAVVSALSGMANTISDEKVNKL